MSRVEDERFLSGSGRFTDDLQFDDALTAVFIRSPYAHAKIRSIDASVAIRMPGVRLFADGEMLVKAGMKPIDALNRSEEYPVHNRDGSQLPDVRRWPLAIEKVRFIGESVAVIVAQSKIQALSAAESVEVEYEPLEAVIDSERGMRLDAPLVWDQLDSNICVDCEYGDSNAVNKTFAEAAHVISLEVDYPRHIISFMEPRAVVAQFDRRRQRVEVYCGSQSAHWHQIGLAEMANWPVSKIRVISPDTGGGFGARAVAYPEYAVIAWLAASEGRTVKWVADRSESFTTDSQSRDHQLAVKLAVNKSYEMTAIQLKSLWRLGAYLNPRSVWLHAHYINHMLCGVYKIPAYHFCLQGVFTNTATIGAFRGVARAEASYAIERVVEKAARQLGIDSSEFRLNNMIGTKEQPFKTATGARYFATDFIGNYKMVLAEVDWDLYLKRKNVSAKHGKLRGIGFSAYVDSVGGAPNEFAEITVDNGNVEARVGTKSIGTSHETVFGQLLASQLQIPIERVRVKDGDTDELPNGSGTHASRSLRIGGTAIHYGVLKILEKARQFSAEQLEVATSDIEYAQGDFRVSGTDRCLSLFSVAELMWKKGDQLTATHEHQIEGPAYTSGSQVCEVEIDPETGCVSIERLVTVNDPGRIVNPQVVEGQVHGGLAQGIGHALLEEARYDESTGQLLTGSYMDYTLPRADNIPQMECLWNEVPTDENPLGVKGVGEIGIMGAPSAIMNAIDDALKELGCESCQMPATPERIWQMIEKAKGGKGCPSV